MIVTRFAPSPNGPLHLGHAYAAVVAHDLARSRKGRFLLRIEDIDGARSRPEFVEEFFRDLEWLGLAWDDDVVFQSRRLASYALAGERLEAMGLVYPCRCTRAETALAPTANGPDGPVYPDTGRRRSPAPSGATRRRDMHHAHARAGPHLGTDKT